MNALRSTAASASLLCVAVFAPRERVRATVRTAFPRRRAKLVIARHSPEFEGAFRTALIDAALVDIGAAGDETWRAAELAREFPSVPFFAITPARLSDTPALSRCASLDFADILTEGVDDDAIREIVGPRSFSARFSAALRDPPRSLAIDTPMQIAAWRCVVAHAGRPLRTDVLADLLGVTREHLSRTFAANHAPNLKRVIDLVRLIAAAELAKNPGYDIGDVARVLGFASSSHLSSTAQRVVGTRPASLARLRAVDLVDRFVQGRRRSRSASEDA
jgi:AraC-like DNA-binding protein